jgi:hypothetical protein
MFAFLDIGGIISGYCNNCGIILHDKCWHLEIEVKLVADGEDENDVFEKGVDSAHFRVSAGSRYERLLRTPVIKCPLPK